MKKLPVIAIAILNILITGCSNADLQKSPSAAQDFGQVSDAGNNEYAVDSSDFYNVGPRDIRADIEMLTTDEKKWLIRMREEEKLARDVYTTLGEKWHLTIFMNIANSEQTHTDSLKTLIERYGIEDPVKNNAVGEYTSPEIKKLYHDLVAQGSNNLTDALTVGAIIEDLDIFDLDVAMSETQKTDINTAYANLQKGSRNHMRAFVKQINNQGTTYTPQYISEEIYNNIISSSQERGRMQ